MTNEGQSDKMDKRSRLGTYDGVERRQRKCTGG